MRSSPVPPMVSSRPLPKFSTNMSAPPLSGAPNSSSPYGQLQSNARPVYQPPAMSPSLTSTARPCTAICDAEKQSVVPTNVPDGLFDHSASQSKQVFANPPVNTTPREAVTAAPPMPSNDEWALSASLLASRSAPAAEACR